MYSFPQRSTYTWNELKEELIIAKNVQQLKEKVLLLLTLNLIAYFSTNTHEEVQIVYALYMFLRAYACTLVMYYTPFLNMAVKTVF